MSRLVVNSEILSGVLEGRQASRQDAMDASQADVKEIYMTADILRKRHKKDTVTFSKKAFFNVINLCRDTCSYCTYKAEPTDAKLSMISPAQLKEMLDLAKRYRCVEALLVTGERPEQAYRSARVWLGRNGFKTTAQYLSFASGMALDAGLFPHTNAGNLEHDELKELKKTNVSIGLMLENASDRLARAGMPHHHAASKAPEARLAVLRDAGRLQMPTTTGILVGIGETMQEVIDSLLAIRDIHDRYKTIQEVIIQNFQPKQDTAMNGTRPAGTDYFKCIVALARIIMPGMNIQIPPNLSPDSYHDFLHLGINDWGGISPLTPDYVNPEFSWPKIGSIERRCADAGFKLECRFPVYPEFIFMASRYQKEKMAEIMDGGLVSREYWK